MVNTTLAVADRDGVDELEEAQTQFAEYLKDFCGGPDGGGTDEESMLLGAQLSGSGAGSDAAAGPQGGPAAQVRVRCTVRVFRVQGHSSAHGSCGSRAAPRFLLLYARGVLVCAVLQRKCVHARNLN